MKKNLSFLAFIAVIYGALAFMTTSCSGDDDRMLYTYVPDNAELVVGADLQAIAENAGCTVSDGKVELSPALEKLLGGDPRTLSIIRAEGLDLSRVLMMLKTVEGTVGADMFVVARVTDNAKLDTYLTSNGMKKSTEKGMYVYTYSDDCSVLVEGGVALYVPTVEGAAQVALDLRSDANKFPVAQWKVDFLQSSTLCALADMQTMLGDISSVDSDKISNALGLGDMKGNKVAMSADLKDNELQYNTRIVDNYGMKKEMDIEVGKLNTSLLKYTDAVDCAALLFAMPSADFVSKLLDAAGLPAIQKATFLMSYSYFKSAMIAAGPIEISDYRDINSWHLVVAAEMQDGKTQEVYDLLKKTMPMMGVCPQVAGDDMTFALPAGFKGYIKKDGDNLAASIMLPVTTDGASAITASDFGDYPAEMIVKIPARDAKFTYVDMPFGVDFKSYNADSESTATLTLTGADGGLLKNIIEVIASYK